MRGNYRLRDADGSVVGPLGFEAVRNLLRSGAISTNAEVARGDGPFNSVGRLNEFQSILRRAAPRSAGYLANLGFGLLLCRLHRQRASGRLEIRRGREYKVIYLEQGDPIFLKSNQPKERLGQYLIGQGLLDQNELRVALESMHVDENRLADTIARLGLLDSKDLLVALREQQVARLIDLCGWLNGDYEWLPDDEYVGRRIRLGIHVPQLVERASRQMSETQLRQRLASILPHRLRLRKPETLNELGLSRFGQMVASLLVGRYTAAHIVTDIGCDEHEIKLAALQSLFTLHQTDHIKW